MTSTLSPHVSHSTLVPREHVHRDAVSEVYLTDIICDRYPNFRVGVHLPKSHSYYSDHVGPAAHRYDPLLVLECFRQTSILIAHRHVGAGFDQSFIFNAGTITIVDDEAMAVTAATGNGQISAKIIDEKSRGEEIIGVTLDMTFSLGGRPAVTMSMTIQWMPRTVWARVRTKGRGALDLAPYHRDLVPQPGRGSRATGGFHTPESLGRHLGRNVVAGEVRHRGDGLEIDLIVDQQHPSLFDHPLDHIPGAVIFEGIRQAGIIGAHEIYGFSPRGIRINSLSADFTRFGELDLHTVVRVQPIVETSSGSPTRAAHPGFRVELLQEDVTITAGRIDFRRRAPEQLPGRTTTPGEQL